MHLARRARLLARPGAAALLLACVLPAQAAQAWNEEIAGDLSDDRLAPTPLGFVPGANTVSGTIGGGGATTDRDYFRFVVPDGAVLTAVIVNPGTSVSGGASFFAIEAGAQITTTPQGQNVQDLLGFGHYGNEAVGSDLLPAVLLNPSAPLAAGTYSVWVQETGGTVPYSFDFQITAVPEPSGVALLGGGLAALALWRRRPPAGTGAPR